MNKRKIQVTQAAYDTLKAELEELMNVKRPKAVERLAFATSQGDLSENSDYTNAKEDLEFLDGRIAELHDVLKNADIVTNNGEKGKVSIGKVVKVKIGDMTDPMEYNIVGEFEADPLKQKISHTSPLGQQLVGKKVGDTVSVDAPVGKVTYEILAIN